MKNVLKDLQKVSKTYQKGKRDYDKGIDEIKKNLSEIKKEANKVKVEFAETFKYKDKESDSEDKELSFESPTKLQMKDEFKIEPKSFEASTSKSEKNNFFEKIEYFMDHIDEYFIKAKNEIVKFFTVTIPAIKEKVEKFWERSFVQLIVHIVLLILPLCILVLIASSLRSCVLG